MKNLFIKFLGGYTQQEFDSINKKLENEIKLRKKSQFRVGDLVFVYDDKFDPSLQYFLLEPYNCNECWYISLDKKDSLRRDLVNGVHYSKLQFQPIKTCTRCNKPI